MISTKLSAQRIEIVLSENGVGISPDALENIFTPLYSTKGFGTGLGLSPVKQILEQHGGGVEIDSTEERGTEVTLWLPRGYPGAVIYETIECPFVVENPHRDRTENQIIVCGR